MSTKLQLRAEITASDSGGSSNAKLCKVPYLTLFYWGICSVVKACGKAEKRSLASPILWKSSANTSISTWLDPTETGDNMHFLCTVWYWVHQGCWPRLLHSMQVPSSCSPSHPFPHPTWQAASEDLSQGKPSNYWSTTGIPRAWIFSVLSSTFYNLFL